jgi:uncharacterized protein (TIGR00251 family)
MIINVKATPNAKKPSVLDIGNGSYAVKVNAPALEGKANERLVELLADHFGVAKSHVRILKGAGSRNKTVEITPKQP